MGMAIKIKIIAGAIVHATSINNPSKRNTFVKLLKSWDYSTSHIAI
jgi:hypothetical protein